VRQFSVQFSLNINIYYTNKLEEISDLKIFLNASAVHCKRCGEPLIAHPCLIPWYTERYGN